MTINTNMYAIALFEAGLESDPFVYLDEMDKFINLLSLNEEISRFFNKTFEEFESVRKILEVDFDKTFINFIGILYDNHAVSKLVSIRDKYESLMMENNYLSIVDIYSKEEVSETVNNSITMMLKEKYPEPFRVTHHQDKSLIGGYVLKVNGDVYDTSLKSRLLQIKKLGGIAYE